MEIGLSLGSNLGDRRETLREAARHIARLPGVRLLAAAPLYETEPVGALPAYAHLAYLNTVLIVEAAGSLDSFSSAIHAIEARLGRTRSADRNAPRTIDIDVLYAGQVVRTDGVLDLPHPRWSQRRFVVQPLADVRPDLVVAGGQRTVRDVLASLPPGEAVRPLPGPWLPVIP